MKYYNWLVILICLVINCCKIVYASNANTKPLSKAAYAKESEGDISTSAAIYKNIDEDSGLGSLSKSPAKIGSRKGSSETNFIAKIAVVDIHAILENSVAVQSIRKSVDLLNKEIQQDISKKEFAFKKEEALLIAQRDSLGELEFERRVSDFNQKVNSLQKSMYEKKRHLEHAHAKAIGKVQEVTNKIINDLAVKHNIDLVMPTTHLLFARNTLNITSKIITELNNKLKYVEIDY